MCLFFICQRVHLFESADVYEFAVGLCIREGLFLHSVDLLRLLVEPSIMFGQQLIALIVI